MLRGVSVRDRAGWLEVLAVSAGVLLAWRLAVPWNLDVRPTGTPDEYASPSQMGWWLVFLVAAAGAFWLGWRRRPRAVVWLVVPLILLASWRTSTAEVIGANMWPLASIYYGGLLAAICATLAALGSARRQST